MQEVNRDRWACMTEMRLRNLKYGCGLEVLKTVGRTMET